MPFCGICGKEMLAESAFCRSCGAPMKKSFSKVTPIQNRAASQQVEFSTRPYVVYPSFEDDLTELEDRRWLLWATICGILVYVTFQIFLLIVTQFSRDAMTTNLSLLNYFYSAVFAVLTSCGLAVAIGRWQRMELIITALSSVILALLFQAVVNALPFHSFWIDVFGPVNHLIDVSIASKWTVASMVLFLLLGFAVGFSVSWPSKNMDTIIKISLAGLLAGAARWISFSMISTVGQLSAKLSPLNPAAMNPGDVSHFVGFPAFVVSMLFFGAILVMVSKSMIESS